MARIILLAGGILEIKYWPVDTGQKSPGGLPPEGAGCLREHPREGFRPAEDPSFLGVLHWLPVGVVEPVADPNLVEVRRDGRDLERVAPHEAPAAPVHGAIGAGLEPVGGEDGGDAVLHIVILSVVTL